MPAAESLNADATNSEYLLVILSIYDNKSKLVNAELRALVASG